MVAMMLKDGRLLGKHVAALGDHLRADEAECEVGNMLGVTLAGKKITIAPTIQSIWRQSLWQEGLERRGRPRSNGATAAEIVAATNIINHMY
jgi:hypothetical protein